jgi:NitT/TauT family transport system permease protein/taurine transport system permease protein
VSVAAHPRAPQRPLAVEIEARLHRVRWLLPPFRFFGAFALLLAVWLALAPPLPAYILPAPAAVLGALAEDFSMGMLPTYVGDSVRHLLVASAVGIAIGVPCGLVIGFSGRVSAFFYPLLRFFQGLSGIAWLPMIIVWFGFTENTITAAVNYTILFPIVFNTMVGVRTVPRIYSSAVRTLGGTQWTVVWDVLVLGALPNIVTGIRMGIAYGWRALIAAEMLIGANGLGYMIFSAQRQGQTQHIIAGMLIIGALWLMLDQLFLRPFEVATVQRWGLVRR